MTRTLKSLDEIADALRQEDQKKLDIADRADPVAQEEQELREARVFQNQRPAHVQDLLDQNVSEQARFDDAQAVSALLFNVADFFSAEVEGFFTDRWLIAQIRMGFDRADYIGKTLIPQVLTEMQQLRTPRGEIDINRLQTKMEYLARLEREKELWLVTHEAAKVAFKKVTGKDFVERGKGTVSRKDIAEDQLAAVLARYGKKAS